MYVRTISRKNKDGSTTTYVQLAHNVRDPQSGFARAQVLYSFGRADSLDLGAIRSVFCQANFPKKIVQKFP